MPENDLMLSELLPGTWKLRASNLPEWLTRGRKSPTLVYTLVSADPLVVSDATSWVSEDGVAESITGVDRWAGTDFVRRGSGLRRFRRGHWRVAGAAADGAILVVRHGKSTLGHDGLDILVRDGVDIADLRAVIGDAHDRFGLDLEDFATLSWFE